MKSPSKRFKIKLNTALNLLKADCKLDSLLFFTGLYEIIIKPLLGLLKLSWGIFCFLFEALGLFLLRFLFLAFTFLWESAKIRYEEFKGGD